jgi:pimeloyl-ACP methyl ester carboxylesterase/class 3 adenylate cyclase
MPSPSQGEKALSVPPVTRYAKSGDVRIAYQVIGDGPYDLIYVPGAMSNVDATWDDPARARYFTALAERCRLILFDKRGTGASDATSVGDLETRIDDVRAVMDAVESPRAAVVGASEGGPMSLLFAALHPERVAALVIYGSLPRFLWATDFPWGRASGEWEREVDHEVELWGTAELAREWLPHASNEELEPVARAMRLGGSPNAYRQIEQMNQEIDVREILPSITVPTAVIHRAEDHLPIEGARWMAGQIPGSTFIPLPGGPHFSFLGDWEAVVSEIQSFVDRVWESGEWDEPEPERILTTILFTDIVGSTAKAAELGDRAWASLVTEHHRRVRARLARFGGREVDTAGDGFFASFDGPARAIRCAAAINGDLSDLGLQIRSGIHTGECEIVDGKIAGIAVNIGARVAAAADAGDVIVSQTVRDIVAGSGIRFEDFGETDLKGIPGQWRLFRVQDS